jgi:hypothetical protein
METKDVSGGDTIEVSTTRGTALPSVDQFEIVAGRRQRVGGLGPLPR